MKMTHWILATLTASFLAFSGAASAQQESAQNSIEAINIAQQGGDIIVKLDMREPLSAVPTGFSVANPARVAFDFPATSNGLGRNTQSVNEGDLRSLNIVQTGSRTRLVLNLSQSMNYSARLEGKSLLVTLTPIVKPELAGQKATQFSPESTLSGRHAIRDITFRRGKDGEGRVLVDLSDTGTGIDIRQQGTSLIVDFLKTSLPENLRRRLDVTDFGTPVTGVVTEVKGDNVRMTISPKGLWEHNAYQSENQFVVEVKKIVEDPSKLVQGSKIGYQGPRVSINYQNGDVRALLRLMAEELGLNAVISESVSGSTTLVLKDVPADQVIDIIFQQRGLDMRKNGNVILIAPRDEIATREKLEYEAKQQIGELEPLRTEIFQINYHKADSIFNILKDKSQTLLSKRGTVVVDSRSNKLFVTDIPSRLDDLRKIVKEIDVPVRQVLIEARIVEADDKFARDIGVRLGFSNPWSKTGSNSHMSVGGDVTNNMKSIKGVGQDTLKTLNNPGERPQYKEIELIDGKPGFPQMNSVNLPAAPRSGTAGVLSFILYNAGLSRVINLELSALEADGRGKIISSPRVMTANQVEALIEQGVEIPYQEASSSGAATVSFRKANLALKVKPQITPDGRVTLTLDINKDSPSSIQTGGAGVAIDTKHVKTEVLVDNGGTVIIGGIYTQDTRSATQKVPLFGDIPLVGWLFKNNTRIDDKTELLIFITPRIVSENLSLN